MCQKIKNKNKKLNKTHKNKKKTKGPCSILLGTLAYQLKCCFYYVLMLLYLQVLGS